MSEASLQLATFGSGCFWCTEAVMKELNGVQSVMSGYAGGAVKNPTYEQVSAGRTGHAEVVQIEFNPAIISFEQIMEVFFLTHDPTQVNRQGNDVGAQYRSVVFTHDEHQQKIAQQVKAQLSADTVFDKPIVTEIMPFTEFYPAEEYHRDYYAQNKNQPYCQAVINPKLAKFRQKFSALRKI
jgi:peptide-methionine (S)-S-oxide reductase